MAGIDRSTRWLYAMMALGLAAIMSARPAPVHADPGTTPWAAPAPIATDLPDATRPSLAFTGDGAEHAVWESEGRLYYATQTPGRGWSVPSRIATGISPVLRADGNGRLHALFANQFMANYEIYDIVLTGGEWSLPVNVSHTSGFSAFPAATAGAGSTLYVAWMDNSPGYWTIYVGKWNGTYWSNQPVPNARGQAPTLASAPDGTLYLAWQDRIPGASNLSGTYDIFLSERSDGPWTLPVNVSDAALVDSIGADLTTTPDGLAHLTWIDGGQEVRYCFGRKLYWPPAVTVVRATALARGPRIATDRGSRLHMAWDEGDMVRAVVAASGTTNWPKPTVIAAPTNDLRDVSLAVGTGGSVAIGWVHTFQPQNVAIYESRRASALADRAWLPVILR